MILEPPIEPMLATLGEGLPDGDGWLFEPKWDGFRAIVFRDGGRLYLQSRDLKPLDRYFPDLAAPLLAALPERCVVDGEIVIATEQGLDFDALQLRLHPAASRVAKLAAETPASFVAFDLLAEGDEDLRARPQSERRARLERALGRAGDRVHLTPSSRDRAVAQDWFQRFEGAGLDGVIAKHESATVPARQARDDQGQALAHGRLRRRGLPLAQERPRRARRLAAARALRRGGRRSITSG